MTRYYSVRRNGIEIKGCRQATENMAKEALKIEIESEFEKLKKENAHRDYKLFINEAGDIGAIDWKGFIPDKRTELCYGRVACYTVKKVEVKTKKETKTKKYEVHYYRCEADVDDIRYFKNLEDLSEWFERQNKMEKTLITKIVEAE